MMRVLVAKELLALVRDGRLLALSVSVLLLGIGAMVVSHMDRERRSAERSELERSTRAQWDQQGNKHPHRGAHYGIYVFAPESALAAFDPGIRAHVGQAIWLEPHRRNVARLSESADDPLRGRMGELTGAFVLTVILPLLIVTLCAASIAGERESGSLRMARGTGMHAATFVISKAVALAAASALIVIVTFAALLALSGDVVRTATLAATYLLYGLIFLSLGLSVSAVSRTTRQAFAILIAVWLLVVWLVPSVGSSLAASQVELPTAEQFWSDIRRDYQNGLPGDGDLTTRGRQFDEQLLSKHGVSRLEDLPFGAYAVRRLNRDAYADHVHQLHFDRLWARFAEQEQVLRYAAVLSPTIAMRLASMKLAGTDLSHRKAFEDAAERYRQYFNTHIDRWDAANTTGLRSFDERYAGEALWQSVRMFEYRPPATADVTRSTVTELLILGAWALGASVLLIFAAKWVRP